MNRVKKSLLPLLFISLVLPLSFFKVDDAAALSGTGYFSGNTGSWTSGYGGDVLDGRPGTNAVPGWVYDGNDTQQKNDFINFIEGRLNGNAQNRTGAAFIVNTMVGAQLPGGLAKDRTPNATMMNEFRQRVRNPALSIDVVTQDPNNYGNISFYDPGINDDFFTNYNSGPRALMRFRVGGATRYVVEIPCGNPVGGLSLPDVPFNNVGSSSVSDGSVTPGQGITFNHRVHNNGPGDMNKKLNAYAEWYGGVKHGDGVVRNCDDNNGLNNGQNQNGCSNNYTIPAGAQPGQNYCQRVVFNPTSSSDSSTAGSNNACAQVVNFWTVAAVTSLLNPPGGKAVVNPSSVTADPQTTNYNSPYHFRHTVTNNGPSNVNAAGRRFVEAWVQHQRNDGAWATKSGPSTYNNIADGGVRTINDTANLPGGTAPADFKWGDKYCQRLYVRYGSAMGGNNGASLLSTPRCITAPLDFNLIPGVSVSPGAVEAEETVSVRPVVNNEGPSRSELGSQWQMVRFKVDPDGTIPAGPSEGTGAPCDYYDNGCAIITQGTGTFDVGNPSTFTRITGDLYNARNFQIPADAELGAKYCFASAVKPYHDESADDWRYGEPTCVIVGKKPKFQIWGYDLRVGGSINTSLSRLTPEIFGSWAEYGAFSNGVNTGMASGSGLLDGGTGGQSNWSRLTFANLPQFGQYGGVVTPTINENGAVAGPSSIDSPLTYGANDKHTYRVNGTLVINRNLSYGNGPYSSISSLPRVLFIADDIVIGPDVTRIDPWLMANRITTCSTVNDAGNHFISPANPAVELDADTCNRPLRFNGPVIANQLYLYRTTNSSEAPAEVFNLRADAFLSSMAGGGTDNPVATTDLVIELPPRF